MRFTAAAFVAGLYGCAMLTGGASAIQGPEEKSKKAFELPADTSGYEPEFVIDCIGYDGPIIRIPPVRFDHARDGDYAIVEFTVTVYGTIGDISIIRSSNPNLNNAIVRFLRRWRYSRACSEGKLVERTPIYQRIRMDFTVPKSGNWEIAIEGLAQSPEPF